MLQIRPEQELTLSNDSFRRRVLVLFERERALCPNLNVNQLSDIINQALATGQTLGVITERELARWSVLGAITNGGCFQNDDVRSYLQARGERDQNKVRSLLTEVRLGLEDRA